MGREGLKKGRSALKTYDVKTDLECLDALLDIVENTKAGFIRNFDEMKSAVFSVIDTDKCSFLFIIDGFELLSLIEVGVF